MSDLIQRNIVSRSLRDSKFAQLAFGLQRYDLFPGEPITREIFDVVRSLSLKHKVAPTRLVIEDALENRLTSQGADSNQRQTYAKELDLILSPSEEDFKILDEQVSSYLYNVQVYATLQSLVQKISEQSANDDNNGMMIKPEDMADFTSKTEEIKAKTFMDVAGQVIDMDFTTNAEEIAKEIRSLEKSRCLLPEDSPLYQPLKGGLAKGELGALAASSGVGKTTHLAAMAIDYTVQGHNVLYVSLEELVGSLAQRFAASLIAHISAEYQGSMNDDKIKAMIAKSAIADRVHNSETGAQDYKHAVEMFQSKTGKTLGKLTVAHYEPHKLTPEGLEQLITSVNTTNEQNIDVLIIDYADLMTVSNHGYNQKSWEIQGPIYEAIRGMLQKYGLVGWTAMQLGKEAEDKEIKSRAMIQGSVQKINTVEFLCLISSMDAERESNFGFYQVAKDRTYGMTDVEIPYYVDPLTKRPRTLMSHEQLERKALLARGSSDGLEKHKEDNRNNAARGKVQDGKPDFTSLG